MQVTALKEEGLKKSFRCVVSAENIGTAIEEELKKVGKSVRIAGFRPGFVPLKILQQRYGKAVQQDVIRNLVTDSVAKIIEERSLRPALSPNVENQEYKEGSELAFTVTMEVLPDLPEITFSDITLEREVFEITQGDIDEGLERLAERSPETVKLADSAKAKIGNVVTMDFKGSIGGVPFEGGSAEKFAIELGSGRLISDFEEQLVGVKAGDQRDVKVTFPEEYFNAEVAGKEATFAVNVQEVAELKTPEITDAFATGRGFSDLRALNEAVRDQLIKDFGGMVRTRQKKALFDILEKKCDFLVPSGMVKMEFDSIWQRLLSARAQGDETVSGKSDEALTEEYQAIAERRVRLGILLAEIARKEKLQISRDELSRALIQHASQFPGQESRVIDYYRQNPERVEELRGPILEEKAVDWVLGKINLIDRPVTTAELLTAEEDSGEDSSSKQKKTSKPKKAAQKKPSADAVSEAGGEDSKQQKPKTSRKKATNTDATTAE